MKSIPQRIQEHVQKGIDAVGYSVMAVAGSSTDLPFAYTIGRVAKGKPELIVFGLGQQNAYLVLTLLIDRLDKGEDFIEGQPINDVCNLPVALKNVTQAQANEYEVQGVVWRENHRFPPPKFNQVVLAGISGKLPWEEGYDWPKDAPEQPLLYLLKSH